MVCSVSELVYNECLEVQVPIQLIKKVTIVGPVSHIGKRHLQNVFTSTFNLDWFNLVVLYNRHFTTLVANLWRRARKYSFKYFKDLFPRLSKAKVKAGDIVGP